MKQLINNDNPNIRIIADEIGDATNKHWCIATKVDAPILYLKEHWTLSDYEEPKSDKVEPIIEDDKTVGVKIPIINKAIYFIDIKKNMKWEEAVKYATSLGKKIPSKKELYILAYFREEIEKIYPKFKDLDYIWGEQYSAYNAWVLSSNCLLDYYSKYYAFTVVPLADLPKQPQLTEFEKALSTICENLSNGLDKVGDIKVLAKNLLEIAKKELEK